MESVNSCLMQWASDSAKFTIVTLSLQETKSDKVGHFIYAEGLA